MTVTALEVERVLAKVEVNEAGCPVWTGGLGAGGYGELRVNWRLRKVHLVMCEHWHGPFAGDRPKVRWSCGNRLCVHPDHIGWRLPPAPIEKLLSRVEVDPDQLCWLTRGVARGRIRVGGADEHYPRARRLAFEHWRGPIPVGCEVVTACGKADCVHPDHLVAKRRGGGFDAEEEGPAHERVGGRQASYDHVRIVCRHGHWIVGDNAQMLTLSGEVVRRCRTCRAERDAATLARPIVELDPRRALRDKFLAERLARRLEAAS